MTDYVSGAYIIFGGIKFLFVNSRTLKSGLNKEYYRCEHCGVRLHVYVDLRKCELQTSHEKQICGQPYLEFQKRIRDEKNKTLRGMQSIDEETVLEITAEASTLVSSESDLDSSYSDADDEHETSDLTFLDSDLSALSLNCTDIKVENNLDRIKAAPPIMMPSAVKSQTSKPAPGRIADYFTELPHTTSRVSISHNKTLYKSVLKPTEPKKYFEDSLPSPEKKVKFCIGTSN